VAAATATTAPGGGHVVNGVPSVGDADVLASSSTGLRNATRNSSVVWLLNSAVSGSSESSESSENFRNASNSSSSWRNTQQTKQRCKVTLCDANSSTTSSTPMDTDAPSTNADVTTNDVTTMTSANSGVLPSRLNAELLLSNVSLLMAHERLLQLRAGLQQALACDNDAIHSVARVVVPEPRRMHVSGVDVDANSGGAIESSIAKLVLDLPAMCILVVRINVGSGMLSLSLSSTSDEGQNGSMDDVGDAVHTPSGAEKEPVSNPNPKPNPNPNEVGSGKTGSNALPPRWGGRHDERTFLDASEQRLYQVMMRKFTNFENVYHIYRKFTSLYLGTPRFTTYHSLTFLY
jgi:hypothetical protein